MYSEIDLLFSKLAFPNQNSSLLLTPGNCFNEIEASQESMLSIAVYKVRDLSWLMSLMTNLIEIV